MTALTDLFMWAGVVTTGIFLDKLWIRFIRPLFARRFGWADLRPDHEIPWTWCICAAALVGSSAAILKYVAPAAGF